MNRSWRTCRRTRPVAMLAMTLLVALVPACGPAEDGGAEGEPQALEVQQTKQFAFSGARGLDAVRYGRYRYEKRCSDYCVDWKPRGRGEICVKWEEQCHWENKSALLHGHELDVINEVPFPAFNDGEQRYMGCGPQALFNLRNWYGFFDRTLSQVAADTKLYEIWFPWDPKDVSIATTPEDLVDAVRNELNNHGTGAAFTVGLHEVHLGAFSNTVESSLTRGDPVIALVRGGSHWQVITGFRRTPSGTEYHVIDYPEGGEWVTEGGLRRELEGGMSFWGELTHFGGYASNLVITIERH